MNVFSIIRKIGLSLAFVLFCCVVTTGQTDKVDGGFDYRFASYLIDKEQYDEALFVINKYDKELINNSFSDTASYLKGVIFYRQMDLENSSKNLLDISQESDYYVFSRFLASYELAHMHDFDKSISILKAIELEDSLLNELKYFQLASVALINNDSQGYKTYREVLSGNFFQLDKEKVRLEELQGRVTAFKKKSPVIAGLMSAIIPGSGKMYGGKIGEGVTSLLGLTILGAMTYENYKKLGLSNYKTITFGSIFSVFYIGNIYGSVYSIKVYRDEFNKSVHNAVLFNMHIPIRTIFKSSFK